MQGKRKKKHYGKPYYLLLLTGLPVLIYLGISVFFMEHFYVGSIINGIDCSGKTVKQVQESMAEDIHKYTLTIEGRDEVTEQLRADDFGLEYVADGKLTELLESQNPFLWPKSLFRDEEHQMSATTTFGKEQLREAVDRLDCMNEALVTPPADAHYEYINGAYEIVAEVQGDKIREGELYPLILEAVEKGSTHLYLEDYDIYQKPRILSSNTGLNQLVNTLNQYTQLTITYDFDDRTEEVTGDLIRNWLVIDGYEVSIQEDSVREYIDSLARTYNTFGDTRKFKTWDGSKVTVKGGDYGWRISRSVETQALIDAIQEGKSVVREPVYIQPAYSRKKNDIGNTYVEINLTAQHMWFYKNGTCLVSTDIVSGNTSRKYGTPVGTYQITYKERNATLSGENYNTPVSYWMPFNYNIGIHDANWRKSFGGEIYKTSGSHGCINTPPKNARIIYENIEAGVPVVVYKKKLPEDVLKTLKEETNQNTP